MFKMSSLSVNRVDPAPGWADFCLCFLKIGAGSFGGPVDYVRRIILTEHQWLDEEQFLSCYSMAICMPGSLGINLCICVGQMLRGGLGAVAAAIFTLLIPTFVVLIFALGYNTLSHDHRVLELLAGAAAGSSAVIASTTIYLMRIGIKGLRGVLIALCAFILIDCQRLQMFAVMILLIPLGLILFQPKGLAESGSVSEKSDLKGHPFLKQLLLGLLVTGIFFFEHSPAFSRFPSWIHFPGANLTERPGSRGTGNSSCPVSIASGNLKKQAPAPNPAITCVELSEMLLPLSFSGFGGGSTILPCLKNQSVDRYAFIDNDQFVNFFTLSNLTPGPSTMIVALIGYYSCHPWGFISALGGALVALLAMFAPATVIVGLLGQHWFRWRHSPWVASFKKAILTIGIGLLSAATLTISEHSLLSPSLGVIFAVSIILSLWKSPSPAYLVLGSGFAYVLVSSI